MQSFRKLLTSLVIFLFLVVGNSFSQGVNLPRSIVVRMDADASLVTDYIVKPKNTLYSITKSYKTDITALKKVNPKNNIYRLVPGDTLTIPFNSELIDSKEVVSSSQNAIPIYYKTRKKDNLFRIARIYFKQEIDHLMQRNKLSNSYLKPGQLILVGWKMPTQKVVYIPIVKEEIKESEKKSS